MHLDPERIQRLLHRELPEAESRAAENHLEACAECEAALDRARHDEEEILGLLEALDHPAPTPELQEILGKAARRSFRPLRWAAGIALTLVATTAAYAAPGSPLPGLVKELLERVRPSGESPAGVPEQLPPELSPAGIAVVPGTSLSIRFTHHQTQGQIRVRLVEQEEVEVRALGPGPGFTSSIDYLTVQNEGYTAGFVVLIPRSAQAVEILIGGRTVFSKAGARIRTAPSAREEGRFLLDLRPPGS